VSVGPHWDGAAFSALLRSPLLPPNSPSSARRTPKTSRFMRTFSVQKLEFNFTFRVPSTHFGQPCQKQPWTNTQVLREGKTIIWFPRELPLMDAEAQSPLM
jgi:hypothetical protein